jgi:hypothetical protein
MVRTHGGAPLGQTGEDASLLREQHPAEPAPDDTVAITYGDLPLKFYTDLRVVGGLTGEDLAPAKAARWVIFRHVVNCDKDYAVAQYFLKNLPARRYRQITLDVVDTQYENRESPDAHQFRTVTVGPRVTILYRMD